MNIYGKVIRILLIVVAVLTVITVYSIDSSRNKKIMQRCTAAVTGEVTQLDTPLFVKDVSTYGNTVHASYQIGYMTYSCTGATHQFYAAGTGIEVRYDPDDPSVAYCGYEPRSPLMFTIIYISSGLVFVGTCLSFRRRRYGSI